MKKYVFSLLILLAATAVGAQESQTEYNFLRLPVSAHGAALGGDNITIIEDDGALTFANPALLSSVSDKTLTLGFMNYMEGANTASAAFAKVLSQRMSIGAAGQFIDYGTMKEMDENNVQQGEFSARDIALAATLSYQLGTHIVGGITAKCIASYIADFNALAVGIDMGVNYYDPERDLSLSAVVKNLGGELDAYEEDYGKLPLDLQLGVTKRLTGAPFRLSATLVDMNHLHQKFINHVVAGVDIILSPQLYVAAGYNFRRAREMEVISDGEERGSSHGAGLSIGAGLMLERVKINLSYAKYHISSRSLMVNLGIKL